MNRIISREDAVNALVAELSLMQIRLLTMKVEAERGYNMAFAVHVQNAAHHVRIAADYLIEEQNRITMRLLKIQINQENEKGGSL